MGTDQARDNAAGFEPPKYVASLIAAINDGAKAAQGSALLFMLVGVYLLATAFSATDEDLLLGKTLTISQIGASLPVTFSFGIAPLVFVFVHVYTVMRYDMLAANLRQFGAELRSMPESDRERCRQLLANVEFVLALTAPRGSGLHSALWPWLFRGIVAAFPVFVLLLVQINALRYQSDTILAAQRVWLALDLAALVWFFRRNPLNGATWPNRGVARARRWAGLLWLPVGIAALNIAYLNIVSADAVDRLIRYSRPEPKDRNVAELFTYVVNVAAHPLDAGLCYSLNWGCRYLRVDRRTLVDKVWDNAAIARMRVADADSARALAGIDGLVLRGRSLRFALLDESRLYAANLDGADLSGASLLRADLSAATLRETVLQRAHLDAAKLQGADLLLARLQGARLVAAQLQGANLLLAQLQGALLTAAQLQGSNLSAASLQGADLFDAQLQVAELAAARLDGTDLVKADFRGADLFLTELQGADLREGRLWHVTRGGANFALADLRKVDFDTPLTDKEQADLRQLLGSLPPGSIQSQAQKRLESACAAEGSTPTFDFTASPAMPVLVSTSPAPPLRQHAAWLIYEPTAAYTEALVELRIKLASTYPAVAFILARTSDRELRGRAATACRLVAEAKAGRVKLEQPEVDFLAATLKREKQGCSGATATK